MNGQADIVWDKGLIPPQLLDVLLKRPDFHTFNYLGTYFIRFNVTRKPFDDPRVRRALALAIDKKRIVEKITKGGEQIASHFVPDGTANYASPDGLGYDPDLAKQLLAEAGYPGGKGFPRFEYMFNAAAGGGAEIHEDIAIELQQMWRDTLGIQMDLRQVEWKVYLSEQSHLDYQLSRASWIGDYDDANTFLGMFITGDGNNETGWSNPRYDALVQQANETTDLKQREQLFQQAETILVHDDLPIIPLYFYAGINYVRHEQNSGHLPKHSGRSSVAMTFEKNPAAEITCIFSSASCLRFRCCWSSARWRLRWCISRPAARSTANARPPRRKSNAT